MSRRPHQGVKTIMTVATLVVLMLAGCTEGPEVVDGAVEGAINEEEFVLEVGKGAIEGLLVDDRFRPIDLEDEPETEFQTTGFILLQQTGQQVQTDANGQFAFVDLEPGSYTLRVTAGGHEAIPARVTVEEGLFAEAQLLARRTNSAGSTIITEEYTVFIPCGYDYVANGAVTDCTFDQSGDSYRPGFTVDYTQFGKDASFLVSEMQANHDDRYEMQVREDDGSSGGGQRLAVAQFQGDYLKLQWALGEINEEWNGQGNNGPWTNEFPQQTILFRDSPGREEAQDAGLPVCCGVGVYFGIKAQFVQSVFLGVPDVDVDAYCILC